MIKKYNKGNAINWTNKDKISFNKLLKKLRIYMFSITNIVITTLLNIADFKLYSAF